MADKSERRGGTAPMGAVLAEFLRENRLDRGLAEQRVLAAWGAALGEPRAAAARAVRFVEGELVVEVSSAAQLQELKNFKGEGLRRSANRALGQECIRRVSYRPRR